MTMQDALQMMEESDQLTHTTTLASAGSQLGHMIGKEYW